MLDTYSSILFSITIQYVFVFSDVPRMIETGLPFFLCLLKKGFKKFLQEDRTRTIYRDQDTDQTNMMLVFFLKRQFFR